MNTLSPPLEIKHDRIDPTVLDAIRKIDEIAKNSEAGYFLAGAMAIEVIIRHVFGRPVGRRTLDVDFGIAVRDWTHFQTLKTALVEQARCKPDPHKAQRLIYPATPPVLVDLIPFGGVEDSEQKITWPPDEDFVMRVTGFSDGLRSAVLVRLDADLVIPVVSIPVLVVLKLFAWRDRKYERRDAANILTLLKEYGEAGNEDRLYGEESNILEAEEYDFELAGARLLGLDAAAAISADVKNDVCAIIDSGTQMEDLINEVIVSSARHDDEHVRRCELLVAKFRDGFLQT
jgi:predicted nucleotidyltransferase